MWSNHRKIHGNLSPVSWRCGTQRCKCSHYEHQAIQNVWLCWLVSNWIQGICTSFQKIIKPGLTYNHFQTGWHQLPTTNSRSWRWFGTCQESGVHVGQHNCHCRGLGKTWSQVWSHVLKESICSLVISFWKSNHLCCIHFLKFHILY